MSQSSGTVGFCPRPTAAAQGQYERCEDTRQYTGNGAGRLRFVPGFAVGTPTGRRRFTELVARGVAKPRIRNVRAVTRKPIKLGRRLFCRTAVAMGGNRWSRPFNRYLYTWVAQRPSMKLRSLTINGAKKEGGETTTRV